MDAETPNQMYYTLDCIKKKKKWQQMLSDVTTADMKTQVT